MNTSRFDLYFENGKYVVLSTLASGKKLTKVAATNFNGYNAYKLVAAN